VAAGVGGATGAGLLLPRGDAFVFAGERFAAPFVERFAAARFAGARFAGARFFAAARFGAFFAAARFAGAFFVAFFAIFGALLADCFFAVLVTFLAAFFAVFLATIGNPPVGRLTFRSAELAWRSNTCCRTYIATHGDGQGKSCVP
jgi:hypothetical protein